MQVGPCEVFLPQTEFGVPINAYSTPLKTNIKMYIYQWIFIKQLQSQSGGYKKKVEDVDPEHKEPIITKENLP